MTNKCYCMVCGDTNIFTKGQSLTVANPPKNIFNENYCITCSSIVEDNDVGIIDDLHQSNIDNYKNVVKQIGYYNKVCSTLDTIDKSGLNVKVNDNLTAQVAKNEIQDLIVGLDSQRIELRQLVWDDVFIRSKYRL